MLVTLGNMRAMHKFVFRSKTRTIDINHTIEITYKFGIKLLPPNRASRN